MKKHLIGLAVGLALTLACAAVGTARDKDKDKKKADDKDIVAARKDVLEMLDLVKGNKPAKDVEAKALAIKKKDVSINDLMMVYALKENGGLGFGAKPEDKSGLEAKLIALQRGNRGPAPATIKKEKDDLIKLAHLNIAMAEIAKPHFPGDKKVEGKQYTKKDWEKWLTEQKAASKELLDAIDKNDGMAMNKAAKKVFEACTECHSVYK